MATTEAPAQPHVASRELDQHAEPAGAAEAAHAAPAEVANAIDTYVSREALCQALGTGHTALVDGQWFVDQHERGGRFLRRQDLERDFPESLVRDLRPENIFEMRFSNEGLIDMGGDGLWLLIAISYPWLAKEHPDPDGVQLEELAHFTKKLIEELKPHGKRPAIFLDYASLHQEERTPVERDLFKAGLRSVNVWYGHQTVQVWALTHTARDRPYHARGWTTFEWRIALLASFFVFDLGQVKERDTPLLKQRWGRLFELGALAAARVKTEPPMAPGTFAGVVEEKTFTNGSTDMPFVQRKYAETAAVIMGSVRELNFASMSWPARDVDAFAGDVLPMCKSLQALNLSRCPGVTDGAVARMAEAGQRLQRLALNWCGGLTDVKGSFRSLQRLYLRRCTGLADVSGQFPQLQELRLSGCTALASLTGEFPSLQLLHLDGCTRLAGVAENLCNVGSLNLAGCSGLTSLTGAFPNLEFLDLSNCKGLTHVAGSFATLRTLHLTKCAALAAVTGEFPALQEVHAGGCDSLAGADGLLEQLQPPSLEPPGEVAGCDAVPGDSPLAEAGDVAPQSTSSCMPAAAGPSPPPPASGPALAPAVGRPSSSSSHPAAAPTPPTRSRPSSAPGEAPATGGRPKKVHGHELPSKGKAALGVHRQKRTAEAPGKQKKVFEESRVETRLMQRHSEQQALATKPLSHRSGRSHASLSVMADSPESKPAEAPTAPMEDSASDHRGGHDAEGESSSVGSARMVRGHARPVAEFDSEQQGEEEEGKEESDVEPMEASRGEDDSDDSDDDEAWHQCTF